MYTYLGQKEKEEIQNIVLINLINQKKMKQSQNRIFYFGDGKNVNEQLILKVFHFVQFFFIQSSSSIRDTFILTIFTKVSYSGINFVFFFILPFLA